MPRAPRIECEGALYHVMCPADRREAIFRGDQDREMFSKTLGESCERDGGHALPQGKLDTGDRSNINRAAAAYCKASDRRVNRLRAILHICPD